jgi:hypothetical protein
MCTTLYVVKFSLFFQTNASNLISFLNIQTAVPITGNPYITVTDCGYGQLYPENYKKLENGKCAKDKVREALSSIP